MFFLSQGNYFFKIPFRFVLCLYNIIKDNIIIKLNSKGVPGIHINIPLENCISKTILKIIILNRIAINAPAAENLNNFTMNNQITQNTRANGHEMIDSSPIKDATPFPPLNFNQIGNIWPNIEKKPHIAPNSFP